MSEEVEFPEPGDIVLATVTKIIAQGAYVTLDEYDDMQGFLHTQEIAPGWIKAINRYVKRGEKKVLRVKKINPERGDIDLSLKQVTGEQRKKKLQEIKHYEKGRTLLHSVADKASLSDSGAKSLEDALYLKFDSVYEAFLYMGRNGTGVLEREGVGTPILEAIRDVCSKIKLPTVEIRGIAEMACNKPDGVDRIKATLSGLDKRYPGCKIKYLGAPRYRVSVIAEDFKIAEKTLKPILAEIQSGMSRRGGTFSFRREESRKNREE